MHNIDTLFALLTPLEMLLINLFVIDRCSKARYSRAVTYLAMGAFGVVILGAAYLILSSLPGFGNGNGLFVFFGFLFLIPTKLLYKNSIQKIICLACTSWVYTFFLFSVSVHISHLVPGVSRACSSFLVQTALYLATFLWFFRQLKYKLFEMLSQLSAKETGTLMWMSIIWFFTVFVLNLAFVYPAVYPLRILAIASAGVCALNFYRYIYHVITGNRTIQSLERIAYHDHLTQLRGRALLASDAEQLISRRVPFWLVFMDLNDFKRVNDTHGHATGDEYLAFFARQVKSRLGDSGGFYRLSGDEFVCLYTGPGVEAFLDSLKTLPHQMDDGVPFLGVSYGLAAYPVDAEDMNGLLRIADENMYKMKKAGKARGKTPPGAPA